MKKLKPVFWTSAWAAALALLASPAANGGLTRVYTDEIKNVASNSALGIVQGELLSDSITRIGKQGTSPLRLYAAGTDSLLHIGAMLVSVGDGTGQVLPPASASINTTFADTTIDFQATSSFVSPSGNVLVDGGTFALPTTTIGQFRTMVMVWRNDGKVDAHFSPAAASLGALENIGTTFQSLPGFQKLGYILLEATASQKYKTAGSSTAIIEDSVSSSPRIVRLHGAEASPLTTAGDLWYYSTKDDRLALGATGTVLHGGSSAPSYSQVVNADVATAAAIARSKLANGTASYVVINDGSGVLSEEQYLATTRGGTGITSTATYPSSGVVVTETSTDQGANRLQSKDLDTSSVVFVNPADTTKKVAFSNTGNTGTTATISANSGTSATLTLPGSTDTLVGRNSTDVLTNKTLSGNTASNFINTGTITLPTTTTTLVGRVTTDQGANRLQSKDLDAGSVQFVDPTVTSKVLLFSLSGATSSTSTTITSSQSTNRVLTLPDATDTLVAKATTDTLTNKTISATANTLQNVVTENDFSGDGSTVDFTLSSPSQALTASKFVQVFVDGRLQREGGGFAYTRTNASPGHIVFTTAPDNGSWIDVTVLNQ